MINQRLPYTATANYSPAADLLEMVFRCAPRMMIAGGGGLEQKAGDLWGKPLPRDLLREIRRRVAANEPMRSVAKSCGVAYNTVAVHTRDIRAKGGAA